MVMAELAEPRTAHILIRGQYDKPGEKVSPAVPAIFPPLKLDDPNRRPNRLDLAKWLNRSDRPSNITGTVTFTLALELGRRVPRGPFVFTHVMRSFDGFHYVYNKPKINYTLIGAAPTRGVLQVDGWGWMKTAFAYASATGQVTPNKATNAEWRVFGIYYDDWRQVLKADNRTAAARMLRISRDTMRYRMKKFGLG